MISLYDALITDALGGAYREDPRIIAIAAAIREGVRLVMGMADNVVTYDALDRMDGDALTLLASELRTPYYSDTLPVETRRELVRNTLRWYQIAGTTAAVEELATDLFGDCVVEEWYGYEGTPYHFRVITSAPASSDNIAFFGEVIRRVKNARSHLESVSIYRMITTGGDHSGGVAFSVVAAPPIYCTR